VHENAVQQIVTHDSRCWPQKDDSDGQPIAILRRLNFWGLGGTQRPRILFGGGIPQPYFWIAITKKQTDKRIATTTSFLRRRYKYVSCSCRPNFAPLFLLWRDATGHPPDLWLHIYTMYILLLCETCTNSFSACVKVVQHVWRENQRCSKDPFFTGSVRNFTSRICACWASYISSFVSLSWIEERQYFSLFFVQCFSMYSIWRSRESHLTFATSYIREVFYSLWKS